MRISDWSSDVCSSDLPATGCPMTGPPSSEGTEAICRVPSVHFSQAPWYTLPDHLCRFRVRSIRRGYFLEPLRRLANPIRPDNLSDQSHISRQRNINRVPIDNRSEDQQFELQATKRI